jgi:chromosome segregation ATPase
VRALEATRQELKETQRTLDEKENLLQALQRRVIELESYKQSGEGKL